MLCSLNISPLFYGQFLFWWTFSYLLFTDYFLYIVDGYESFFLGLSYLGSVLLGYDRNVIMLEKWIDSANHQYVVNIW